MKGEGVSFNSPVNVKGYDFTPDTCTLYPDSNPGKPGPFRDGRGHIKESVYTLGQSRRYIPAPIPQYFYVRVT